MLLHIKFIGSIFCLICVVSKSSAFVQPIAPETNRCNETEYFNPVTKNCTKFRGGGRAMLVDQNKQCPDNFQGVKPYLDTDKLYVICEKDLVVLATCPDNLIFNQKTLQCEAIKNLPCGLANMPVCTKTGRFALDTNSSCYYTCDENGEKLIPTIYQCRGISLYSQKLQRCSYSCKTPPTQIFDGFDMDPKEKGFFPPCFKPGQFRTPTDCSRYYKCSAKTNGRFYQTRLMCPDATIYDINTESCRPRAEVACEMMSVVELLNLYEFYKQRRQQCELNYIDDKSIENCMKACAETGEIPITTVSSIETITSTLSPTESIDTTTKPIETTEMGVTSILSETPEDSEEEEEDSMELLDESTSLRPRKTPTTTTESSQVIENTSTVSLEPLSSTTLETSTQSQTEQSLSTIQNSELNDTDSITDDPTVDLMENITNYSNVSSTTEVSSAQEILKTTTGSTIIHETSVDSNISTTTAIFVPSNNDTNLDDISKSNTELPIESTSTPELVSTPETTTAIIITTTEVTIESTETIINTTENEGTSERATTVGDIKSTDTTLSPSSPVNDENSTIENTMPLEITTILNDENRSIDSISPTIIGEDESLDQEQTESTVNIANSTDLTEEPLNEDATQTEIEPTLSTENVENTPTTPSLLELLTSTKSSTDSSIESTSMPELVSTPEATTAIINTTTISESTEFASISSSDDQNVQNLDETTTNATINTSSSIPETSTSANTDIPTATVGLESVSLISSNETSSSNTVEPVNTTTNENETESTTTEQIQQSSSSSIENSTLFLLDESATIRTGNETTTENISSSTESSKTLSNDGDILFSSTIPDDETTKSTTVQNDNSTDAVTLESESLIESIVNETEPTSDNSTTEVTIESTETMKNTTENEGTSERATTVGEIKSTEPTTVVNSTPEDAISQTFAPDLTTENIDSSTLNATEIDQNTTESAPNTFDTTLSPSSPVNDENSTVENTMPLEITTIQNDENRSTDSISSTIIGEDESLDQEQTESSTDSSIESTSMPELVSTPEATTAIINTTTTSESMEFASISSNDDQNVQNLYETTTNATIITSSSIPETSTPANTDIATATFGLESDSLVISDENSPTTSSSNTAEPVNTTTKGNETESTTTEQIQQSSSSSMENSTLFLLDESATIRTENETTTENISSSTEISQTLPNDGDTILDVQFNPVNENGLTTSESSVSETKPVFTPEITTPVLLNSTTETAKISSFDENTTPRHEDESSVDPSEVGTSSTESSILSNQTQAQDDKQPENESLTSPNLYENQEQENDSTTQESFNSNSTIVSYQETTTVAPESGITNDLKPTFRISTENEENSSSLPISTENEPNITPKTDLVVESLLGDNTENSFISNSSDNTSNDAETTNISPIWNTTTISDQETTTLAAATNTMYDVESIEMTTAQILSNTTAKTTQSNIETSTQGENSTFEMSTEMEVMINTTIIQDEIKTVETASKVMQSNSTSNEEATQIEIESTLSPENEENTPTTPSLLELLTSTTWWPSSTEKENETTEELNDLSTESTSTESTLIVNTTEIKNATDSTISSNNATEAVHKSNNVTYNNTFLDFEIKNVENSTGPPEINLHVKRNAVIHLNFTGDCC